MKTTNLVESLKQFGIRAIPYRRPPAGKNVFVIAIAPKGPEGTIQVNQGRAKVDIHGSKKHRQAVITVAEEPRVITRPVKGFWRGVKMPSQEEIRNFLRGNFSVTIPGNVTWSYSNIKCEKRMSKLDRASMPGRLPEHIGWDLRGTVTAKAGKRTTNHFLLGMDETHNFIAPLRKAVKSVEDAHRILKPKARLVPGTKRQGEWYFEPVPKAEAAELDKLALTGGRVKEIRLEGSTHRAQSAMVVATKGRGKGKNRKPGTRTIYARGYVKDNRKGHHSSIFLPTWHKVVRNREITYKRSKSAPRRRSSYD